MPANTSALANNVLHCHPAPGQKLEGYPVDVTREDWNCPKAEERRHDAVREDVVLYELADEDASGPWFEAPEACA